MAGPRKGNVYEKFANSPSQLGVLVPREMSGLLKNKIKKDEPVSS